MGVDFYSFSYFGVSGGVSGTGSEKDAEKVRNETFPNLENCVPVYTGAQFSFSPRHLQTDFELIHGFIWIPLATLYGDFQCFVWVFFLDRIYGCIVIFGGAPSTRLGSPGEGF